MEPTYRDRAVLLGETLVLSDLHVGKGAASNLEIPVGDGTDMVERVRDLVEWADPEAVVIAGDLLHSFGTIPRTVEQTLSAFRSIGENHGARVLVTPGNHDTMLDSVWDGPTAETHRVGETVICHGHVAPEVDAERYVVGHDHPTIEIEGQRRPCYLYGEEVYRGADVLMLPPFNRLVRGVAVNTMRAGDFHSPLIRDPDAFRPLVWDDGDREALEFPPLGEFRRML